MSDDRKASEVEQTITCSDCGQRIDVTGLTKEQAFQEAQDHEDIEHEGSKIEWHTVA